MRNDNFKNSVCHFLVLKKCLYIATERERWSLLPFKNFVQKIFYKKQKSQQKSMKV